MIGKTLDRYVIESKLGEGGMGVVYQARDTQLDRLVAIKILLADKVTDPDRKQRFFREARTASALNHPGIATVHDIRSDAGIDFLVMEHVGGRTLDRVVAAKRLGMTQALSYGVQIADALSAAHAAGIIHRDLKPSNVMVTSDDRIKILDFGVAKLLDPVDGTADVKTRTALTEPSLIVGTAAYMSPEQAEARTVDARSDIFSLGAVLYELVTGRRPFVGESAVATLAKILNEDPRPPSQIAAAVSIDVDRMILRCLRKDPARRYQTMADLKVALEDLAASTERPEQTSALSAARRWRWAWTVLIPVVLAATYFAARAARMPERATALRAVPLTSLPGVVRFPSFAPDGNHVAFIWSGPTNDNRDVYVQQIGAGSPLRLTTDPADDSGPVWSPDGRSIAFLRRRADPRAAELRLIAPLGGAERKVAEIRPHQEFLRPVTLGWCPDSRCLIVTDSPDEASPEDALFVISLETGEKRQLTFPQHPALADTDPAVSPDGKWLAFRRDSSPFTGQLELLALGAALTPQGEPRPLTAKPLFAYSPQWMPDSSEIIFSAKAALWRLGISEGSTAERLPFVGEDGLMPVVSRPARGAPARLVYVRSFADTNIWRIQTSAPGVPATSPPVIAISSTRHDNLANLSSGGQRVVFISDRSGEQEIWVAEASGSNPVQLTAMGFIPGFPRWSQDGKTIAFHSNPEGQGDIIVVPGDGGKPRNLTAHPSNDVFPSFSRDGQWIYFSSTRSGSASIWKVPPSGGDAIQVSSAPGLLAMESPDGAYLYYVESTVVDLPGMLRRLSLTNGEVVTVAENVLSTSFEVIDGGIYYLERVAGDIRLIYFNTATRRSTLVAANLGNVFYGLTASPDGRSILYSRVDSSVDNLMLVDNFR